MKRYTKTKKKFKTLSVLITFDSSELVKFLLIVVTFNILLGFLVFVFDKHQYSSR